MLSIPTYIKDFPVLQRFTYLNTAASGLLREELMEWRQNEDIDFLIGGSNFRLKTAERLSEVREAVARFFNAQEKEAVLVPNFTLGLRVFVEGLDRDQKVLLLEDDFPSLQFPFASAGFKKVDTLPITWDVEEQILQQFKENTPDIFAFSVVQYISGVKLDLDFIDELKKAYPSVLFIADATQYSGTESFDFKTSGIDVFGGSGYKWLMAGYGNGYLLVKEAAAQACLKQKDFSSIANHPAVPHQEPLQAYLEMGHLDTLNFGSLSFALKDLNAVGMDVIQAQIQALSSYAKEQFSALGLLDEAVSKREKAHSGIFNLKLKEAQIAALKSRDIIGSPRGNGYRLSFHFFNTTKEVDKVVGILKNTL